MVLLQRSLVIDTNYPGMYEEDFSPRMLFEGLPELKELTESDAGSVQKWLCPHLDKLVFDGISVNIEVLWLFIESRYCRIDQVQKPDKLVNLRVVNAPTTFNCKSILLNFASNLADVVGRDGFVWGNRKLDASGDWVQV
ncbi:hypothetical protein FRC03_002475 [Tulasnella sp. 419]|nr:hypothetical protein FRC03_002475 [Tulasnella sp. 419]